MYIHSFSICSLVLFTDFYACVSTETLHACKHRDYVLLNLYKGPSLAVLGPRIFIQKRGWMREASPWLASSTGFDGCLSWETCWCHKQRKTTITYQTIQGCWCESGIHHSMEKLLSVWNSNTLSQPKHQKHQDMGRLALDSWWTGLARRCHQHFHLRLNGEEEEKRECKDTEAELKDQLGICDTSLGTSEITGKCYRGI